MKHNEIKQEKEENKIDNLIKLNYLNIINKLNNNNNNINNNNNNNYKYNYNLNHLNQRNKENKRNIEIGNCFLLNYKYYLPIFTFKQRKETFLQDVIKLIKDYNSHLIVLFDDDNHIWSNELSLNENEILTISDVNINIQIESECSNNDGSCVLTWLRYLQEDNIMNTTTTTTNENVDNVDTPIIYNEQEAYGYRFAILRISNWVKNTSPNQKIWDTIETLYTRAIEEIRIAYHDSSMFIIDVNDGNINLPWIDSNTSTESHWGIGNRTGLFIAMDISLHFSKFNNENKNNNNSEQEDRKIDENILQQQQQQLSLLSSSLEEEEEELNLITKISPSPSTFINNYIESNIEISSNNSQEVSKENSIDHEVQKIIQSCEESSIILNRDLNQKKEEASNRLKQRLKERKNKNQIVTSNLETNNIPIDTISSFSNIVPPLPSPSLSTSSILPPLPPPLQLPLKSEISSESQELGNNLVLEIEKQQDIISRLIEEIVTFSPSLFLTYEQYYFLTQNHMYKYYKSKDNEIKSN